MQFKYIINKINMIIIEIIVNKIVLLYLLKNSLNEISLSSINSFGTLAKSSLAEELKTDNVRLDMSKVKGVQNPV